MSQQDYYNRHRQSLISQFAMSLVYTLVAREQVVLADHSEFQGNFALVALNVLAKVDPSKTYAQFASGKYFFYTYLKHNYVFQVMVESSYEIRIAVNFLKTIERAFFEQYNATKRDRAVAHSLEDFKPILKYWMKKYKNKAEVDKLQCLKRELSQLQEQTLLNLDKVIERGEKIEVVVKKSQNMAIVTYDMVQVAERVKRKMWWKNKKVLLGTIALVLTIVAIVAILIFA